MMKKNGFTLAEVLITLAIIGVVATMTLPALMTNTAEQQAKSAMKKGINTFTEAAQMSQAVDGYDYASTNTTGKGENDQSIYGLLSRRAAVDWGKTNATLPTHPNINANSNYVMYFRDGSAISFPNSASGTSTTAAAMQNDNLPYGIPALYDINGVKGPNMISNCSGNAAGLQASAKDSTAGDHNKECTKVKRVIKDQFGIRLRGGFAVPNGAAARWTFEN